MDLNHGPCRSVASYYLMDAPGGAEAQALLQLQRNQRVIVALEARVATLALDSEDTAQRFPCAPLVSAPLRAVPQAPLPPVPPRAPVAGAAAGLAAAPAFPSPTAAASGLGIAGGSASTGGGGGAGALPAVILSGGGAPSSALLAWPGAVPAFPALRADTSHAAGLALPGAASGDGDTIPHVGVSLAGLERFAAELAAATRGLPGGYEPHPPPHEHALIAERATNVCCDICGFDPSATVAAARRRVRAAQLEHVEARGGGGSRLRVQASRRRLYLAQGRLNVALRRRLWNSCRECDYNECMSCFAESERLAQLPPPLTTEDANKLAMAHLTGASHCAFSDLLGDDPALVGEATVFVSHSWAAPLDALVACVREADAALRRPSHPPPRVAGVRGRRAP